MRFRYAIYSHQVPWVPDTGRSIWLLLCLVAIMAIGYGIGKYTRIWPRVVPGILGGLGWPLILWLYMLSLELNMSWIIYLIVGIVGALAVGCYGQAGRLKRYRMTCT